MLFSNLSRANLRLLNNLGADGTSLQQQENTSKTLNPVTTDLDNPPELTLDLAEDLEVKDPTMAFPPGIVQSHDNHLRRSRYQELQASNNNGDNDENIIYKSMVPAT